MNILIEGSVFQEHPTGIAKVTLALYNACKKIEPALQVSLMHQKRLASSFPGYIKTIRAPFWVNKRNWKPCCLEKYVTANPGGICHFPWNGDIPENASSLFTVMTLHDVLPLIIPFCFIKKQDELNYKIRLQKDIYRADLIITDSNYSKTQVLKHFHCPAEPVVIYPASTLETVQETDVIDRPVTAPYFLYVGGYAPRKGLIQLLDAFMNLYRERNFSHKLVLAGKPSYFSLEFKRKLKQGIEAGIVIQKGYVPDSELVNLYRFARGLVYLSKYEGFGLPPLEAMSLGCPVITTASTSIVEICDDAVLYVDPDSPRELMDAIQTLANQNTFHAKLIKRGYQRAQQYSWDKAATQYLQLLDTHLLRGV